jgi:predicted lactoylglutathione lyase
MQQRAHFITLGVADVTASQRFYVDGLGWEPTLALEEVCFLQVAPGVLLALWAADALAQDTGRTPSSPSGGVERVALASNVASAAEVDAAVERVVAAGGTVLKAPQATSFGYHAYVADPDGVCWEIAHNPGWSVDDDGTVHIG